MSKLKRWWIAPKLYKPADPVEAEYFIAYDQPGDPNRLEIEAVEVSAYEDLLRKLEDAEETLKWYAVNAHCKADTVEAKAYFERKKGK